MTNLCGHSHGIATGDTIIRSGTSRTIKQLGLHIPGDQQQLVVTLNLQLMGMSVADGRQRF
jgi:hypothetical protein